MWYTNKPKVPNNVLAWNQIWINSYKEAFEVSLYDRLSISVRYLNIVLKAILIQWNTDLMTLYHMCIVDANYRVGVLTSILFGHFSLLRISPHYITLILHLERSVEYNGGCYNVSSAWNKTDAFQACIQILIITLLATMVLHVDSIVTKYYMQYYETYL